MKVLCNIHVHFEHQNPNNPPIVPRYVSSFPDKHAIDDPSESAPQQKQDETVRIFNNLMKGGGVRVGNESSGRYTL